MKHIYYRHKASQGLYQVLGRGALTLGLGSVLKDNDTIYVINGGDAPPYIFVSDQRTQVRKGDQVLEVTLQAAGEVLSGTEMVLYRNADTGTYWARPVTEFFDGRFTELDANLDPLPEVKLDMSTVAQTALQGLEAQQVAGKVAEEGKVDPERRMHQPSEELKDADFSSLELRAIAASRLPSDAPGTTTGRTKK